MAAGGHTVSPLSSKSIDARKWKGDRNGTIQLWNRNRRDAGSKPGGSATPQAPAGRGGPQAIAGNGFTYRHDWGLKHGQWILPLTWSGFTNATRVFVAIGEGTGGGGKFVGSARYTVHNVAPDTGRVTIWVDIEWGSDISLIVDYLIIEP